jgi:hypothetical protein
MGNTPGMNTDATPAMNTDATPAMNTDVEPDSINTEVDSK